MSREYTRNEVENKFLQQVESYVRYWTNIENKTKEEALKGLAFSIMVILDGGSMNLPSFAVIPCPHESDKEYYKDLNERYYRYFENKVTYCDIAGPLHEKIFKEDR